VSGNGLPVLIASLVNYGVRYQVRARVEQSLEGLDEAARELTVLAELLRLIEARKFTSPKLRGLRAALDRDGMAPSTAIARLERVLHRLDSRHNMMLRALDLFAFWTVQASFVAEGWKRQFGPGVRGWLAAAGEFEALESLAGYAYEHPADVWPEFVEDGAYLRAEGFAHPLLPEARAIRNDLELGDLRLVVISGPNMAGKSTFLRGLGVNVVLAQMGAPVRARRLRLSPLMVGASIAVMDSLESGISRFYAEIRRVKLISDLADGTLPVLFLLDEVLSGTNSHDRLIGTEWMVRSFVERGAIGIVTTHDLALTAIPETMDGRGVNCHFSDTIVDGRLHFDYRLAPGVVETSNALELMRSIGLRVDG
jgi:DNA mismatch repair ATPase MutS